MKQTTLVFLFNSQGQILLARKKRWFGFWKWNGPGGKVMQWETIIQWALRELEEETGVVLSEQDLLNRGILHFRSNDTPEVDQDCSLFSAQYDGKVFETEEMQPQWFDLDTIPFDDMWEDDRVWMPRFLTEDTFIEYNFFFEWKDICLSEVTKIL